MLVRELEPWAYLLPIKSLKGKEAIICAEAFGQSVKCLDKGYKGACKFWNSHYRRYSRHLSKMPGAFFSGEIKEGLLHLEYHPDNPNDPLPRKYVMNPFTGFMCESVKDFSGCTDLLSLLWNMHCGFISKESMARLATENPVPVVSCKSGVVEVKVPTRDLTYITITISEFVKSYGMFADYYIDRVEDRDVSNSSDAMG